MHFGLVVTVIFVEGLNTDGLKYSSYSLIHSVVGSIVGLVV